MSHRRCNPKSVAKTLALMQTILERAVVHGRLTFNPAKAVKEPSTKRTNGIRPLSPAEVERIRAHATDDRDATLVSLLAYAGLRPGEARALTWGDIGRQTIPVERAVDPSGEIKPTKTGETRNVRLLAPLRADLAAWREACGNPADGALIFPRTDGDAWTETDWRNWARRRFARAAREAGVEIRRPYDLRHSAASLWLHEGTNPVQVARWLGHNVAMTYRTYAHVIDDLDPNDRSPATDVIEAERDKHVTSSAVMTGQP